LDQNYLIGIEKVVEDEIENKLNKLKEQRENLKNEL
jgi:hypothetical protein